MPLSSRQSHGLTPRQLKNMARAFLLADRIGVPLSIAVSAHFGKLALSGDSQRDRERFLTCVRRWLSRRNIEYACIWTVEAPRDFHLHAALHVPEGCYSAFARQMPAWLGAPPRTRFISEKRGGVLGVSATDDWHVQRIWDLEGWRDYILKGADASCADAAEQLGIHLKPTPQGIVTGKRCGFSNSLGHAAERAFNARSASTLPSRPHRQSISCARVHSP